MKNCLAFASYINKSLMGVMIISSSFIPIMASASSVSTFCELIGSPSANQLSYFCDSFGNGATIVSQTWSAQINTVIIGQGDGFVGVECSFVPGPNAQFSHLTTLSDGSVHNSSVSVPCDNRPRIIIR